jgi:hypothetical protein
MTAYELEQRLQEIARDLSNGYGSETARDRTGILRPQRNGDGSGQSSRSNRSRSVTNTRQSVTNSLRHESRNRTDENSPQGYRTQDSWDGAQNRLGDSHRGGTDYLQRDLGSVDKIDAMFRLSVLGLAVAAGFTAVNVVLTIAF